MLKRTDIVDEKMLNDLRVIADFACAYWECESCPLNTGDIRSGCASLNAKCIVDNYDDGEEVIY